MNRKFRMKWFFCNKIDSLIKDPNQTAKHREGSPDYHQRIGVYVTL